MTWTIPSTQLTLERKGEKSDILKLFGTGAKLKEKKYAPQKLLEKAAEKLILQSILS